MRPDGPTAVRSASSKDEEGQGQDGQCDLDVLAVDFRSGEEDLGVEGFHDLHLLTGNGELRCTIL